MFMICSNWPEDSALFGKTNRSPARMTPYFPQPNWQNEAKLFNKSKGSVRAQFPPHSCLGSRSFLLVATADRGCPQARSQRIGAELTFGSSSGTPAGRAAKN